MLTAGDSNVPALTTRMAFWALRVVHEHGVLVLRASSDNVAKYGVGDVNRVVRRSAGTPLLLGSSSFPRLVGPRRSLGEHPYVESYLRVANAP